jgi:hypothetical protein
MVRHAFRDGVAAGAVLLGLSLSGCVSADFPAPPSVEPNPDAGAGPTLLVSASGCGTDPGSIDFVVADGTLFWTEKFAGTVNSVPTIGGSKTVIATGQALPGPLAVDETSIFWVEAGKQRIMTKARGDTAPPTVLVEPGTAMTGNENAINALLVSDGTLFFGRFTSALKVPTTGGTPIPIGLSPDDGQPAAFAIDAAHLYQTELGHNAISREKLDGTQDGFLAEDSMTRAALAPDRIAVSQSELVTDAIAVVNGNVIWANLNVIEYKPVDAGERDPSFPIVSAPNTSPPNITGFVVSDGVVYFGESAFDKVEVVAKVPLSTPQPAFTDAGAVDAAADDAAVVDGAAADAGGPATPVVIATDQQSPSLFAADATNIYWRTADCKIMKLAK